MLVKFYQHVIMEMRFLHKPMELSASEKERKKKDQNGSQRKAAIAK